MPKKDPTQAEKWENEESDVFRNSTIVNFRRTPEHFHIASYVWQFVQHIITTKTLADTHGTKAGGGAQRRGFRNGTGGRTTLGRQKIEKTEVGPWITPIPFPFRKKVEATAKRSEATAKPKQAKRILI